MSIQYVNNTEKGLSYSKMQKLSCPRKFQIQTIIGFDRREDKPHFSYGHFVAGCVQEYFRFVARDNFDQQQAEKLALLASVKEWEWPEFWPGEYEHKKFRTFYHGVVSYTRFLSEMRNPQSDIHQAYSDYEVAVIKNDKGEEVEAVELEFLLELPNGYSYEGHVDLILQHKETKQLLVIELKTTSLSNLHPAMYKNSFQALGYTIVCDQIALSQGIETVKYVDYLVYKNRDMSWNRFRFPKSLSMRADFIWMLRTEIERIELMKENDTFPKNGDECFSFFSPCEYYDVCDSKDSTLRKFAGKRGFDENRAAEMDFTIPFEGVIAAQIKLAEQSKMITSDQSPWDTIGDGEIINVD